MIRRFVEADKDSIPQEWIVETDDDGHVTRMKSPYVEVEKSGEDGFVIKSKYTTELGKKGRYRVSFCDLDTASKILKIWQHIEPGWFDKSEIFGEIKKL